MWLAMTLLLFFFVMIIVLGMIGLWLRGEAKLTSLQKSENDKLFREGATKVVDSHIDELARQRLKLIKVERYGVINTSIWDAEVQDFIDKILFPDLVANDEIVIPAVFPKLVAGNRVLSADLIAKDPLLTRLKEMMNPILREIIEERAGLRAAALEHDLVFSKDMTPQEFERWCTKTIVANGWEAIMTKASGDQGADIIAEKGGVRFVIQCKLYSSPVGNKAVQEAFAAQRHDQAHASAVVANAAFTASAAALAATTGVQLLHYTDLDNLKLI